MIEEKGKSLESEVYNVVLRAFDGPPFKVLRNGVISGASRDWKPDILVLGERPWSSEDSIHAVSIECKEVGKPQSWKYHAMMCDAYVELNDIRLNLGSISNPPQYYLIVNRLPQPGDSKSRITDYVKLFDSIGVHMIVWEHGEMRGVFENLMGVSVQYWKAVLSLGQAAHPSDSK